VTTDQYPQGLHMGLAAWIHQARTGGGFLAALSDPISFDPRSIVPVEVSLDPFKQAEISRAVNLLPRKGDRSEVFGAGPLLWDRFSEVLGAMVFAKRALTDSQAAAVDDAKTLLYTGDPPQPSPRYRAYLEMRQIVRDLVESGASADRLTEAYADWEVLGYKSPVEQALSVIVRAGEISSAAEALSMKAGLDPMFRARAGEQEYVPSYFAPLSAADLSTWTTARVSLAALSGCAAAALTPGAAGFVSASQAICEFAYAVVEVIRTWFSAEIFKHDDWRLGDADTVVADGDGRTGLLPAHAQVMYLARVNAIFGAPPPVTPPIRSPIGAPDPPVLRPVRPMVPGTAQAPLEGVIPRSRLEGGSTVRRPAVVPVGTRSVGGELVEPLPLTAGNVVLGARLNRADWRERLRRIEDPAPPEPSLQYGSCGPQIVGFGCSVTPASPHPNNAYLW
jgi:hypothetical protein